MEGYAAASKRSGGSGAFVFGLLIGLMLGAGGLWLYFENNPPEPVIVETGPSLTFGGDPTDAAAAPRERVPTVAEATGIDVVEAAEQDAQASRQEADKLRSALAQARADAARYQGGLERAVAELNRMKRDPRLAANARTPGARRTAAPQRGASLPMVTAGIYRTNLAGNSAVTNDWAKNHGRETAYGVVVIEWREGGGGRVLDSETIELTLSPGEQRTFSRQFEVRGGQTMVVNASWEHN